jgi:hypothetical protein
MVRRALPAAAVCVVACATDAPVAECPEEERFTSTDEDCPETYCGEPEVWALTGNSPGTLRRVVPDDPLPIRMGAAGGYHLDGAAEMTNLCSVVYLRWAFYDESSNTSWLIHQQSLHGQACRTTDACAGVLRDEAVAPSTHQRWWGTLLRFPCRYWPDPPLPDQGFSCWEEHVADFDTLDLRLHVVAEDHNGRRAVRDVSIAPQYDRVTD